MTDFAHIIEVSPRDGLQNEPVFVATGDKLELVARLIDSGLHCIEATSFVSPKWVPQMADADAVCDGLPSDVNCRFPVLVPNLQGYMRARACGVKEVAVFTAASETFSHKKAVMKTPTWFDPALKYPPFTGKLKLLKWLVG